jgi:hypothetical protein
MDTAFLPVTGLIPAPGGGYPSVRSVRRRAAR